MVFRPPSAIVQKVVALRALKHSEGKFLLWDTPCTILPIQMSVLKMKLDEEAFGKYKTHKIEYYGSKIQAKTGVTIVNKKFGYAKTIQDKRKLILFNIGQFELLGHGKFNMSRQDFKSNLFIAKSVSQFAIEYKSFYGPQKECVDFFIAGLWAGCIEGIMGKKVACIETSCVAKGNSYCEFVIKEVDKWDKNDLKVKKNSYIFEKDIEEKVMNKWKIFTI